MQSIVPTQTILIKKGEIRKQNQKGFRCLKALKQPAVLINYLGGDETEGPFDKKLIRIGFNLCYL